MFLEVWLWSYKDNQIISKIKTNVKKNVNFIEILLEYGIKESDIPFWHLLIITCR